MGLVDPRSATIRLKVHQQLARLHPADLADIIEDLGRVERQAIVSTLDPETAAQALSETEPEVQAAVVEAIDPDRAADLLEEMPPDEAADILGDLTEERSQAVLEAMEEDEAEDVRELLAFNEDSAGGLMTTEFFRARGGLDGGRRARRRCAGSTRTVAGELDEVPVVTEDGKLVGMAPLVRLVRVRGRRPGHRRLPRGDAVGAALRARSRRWSSGSRSTTCARSRWSTSSASSWGSSTSRTSSRRLGEEAVSGWLRRRLRAQWRRIAWLFAILGPGVITSNVDNDAGGIYTYSLAGARYGYSLLWVLLPVTVALVVVQEMCARMGTVTGKGLADLIREQFGLRITFLVMMARAASRTSATRWRSSPGVASSLELFGVSRYVSVPLGAAFVWWLVVFGSYKSVEKVFLVACLIYLAYPISGFLAHPDWAAALRGQRRAAHAARLRGHRDGGGHRRHHDRAVDAVLPAVLGGRAGVEGVRLPARCGST